MTAAWSCSAAAATMALPAAVATTLPVAIALPVAAATVDSSISSISVSDSEDMSKVVVLVFNESFKSEDISEISALSSKLIVV